MTATRPRPARDVNARRCMLMPTAILDDPTELTGAPASNAASLRVLDVTNFYSAASGGVKTYLNAKVRDFADRGISHAIVVPGRGYDVTVRGATRVYRLRGPAVPFGSGYRFLISPAALRRVIERERPDVIEIGGPFLPVLVRRALRGRCVPTVGFYHSDLIRAYAEPYATFGVRPLRPLVRSLARRAIRRIYQRFDATVAGSAAVATELRGLGIPRVHYVPLGVDLAMFSRQPDAASWLRARCGVEPGASIALYVGRFYHEKRLDVLLRAHERIEPERRPHLMLVGDGPQRDRLVAEASRRERLTVLPYETDADAVARLYSGADFYVAPGPGETFGLAIAEALACGLPVVAVASGAAPDRIAGSVCGRLYRAGDVDACADALVAMSRDAARLHDAARAHACRTLDWRRTFDKLHALYAELATGPTS